MPKKGSEFEREISKRLSLWWSDGKRDDIFWRTSGSGARATTRRKKSQKTAYEYGDITFTDPDGKPFIDYFLVELKRGYSGGGRLDAKRLVEILNNLKQGKVNTSNAENSIKKLLAHSRKSGSLTVLDLVDSDKELQLLQWWNKATEECKDAGRKEPIIIFKRDGKKECVMVKAGGIISTLFIKSDSIVSKSLQHPNTFPFIVFGDKQKDDAFVIIRLDVFMDVIKPTNFLKRRVRNG